MPGDRRDTPTLSDDTPTPFADEDPALRPGGFRPTPYVPTYSLPPPRPRFQHKHWKHALFFLLTFLTTTAVGAGHYASYLSDFSRREFVVRFQDGFWYSGTILLILLAHEMGHYLYCRRYRVDATLPYFLPVPPLPMPFNIGTLGAVIRIREAFPNRKALFDIGVAGPIAGFAVLVPVLFIGLRLSEITAAPPANLPLLNLGEPLLYKLATRVMFGTLPETQTLNLHPMVLAAWVGMLATSLNLLPFGQLDGGHLTYATLGPRSTWISIATVAGAIAMTFVSSNWILIAVLMIVMMFLFGPRHPPVLHEYEPLGRGRAAVALFALLMLILCCTPVPIEVTGLPPELLGK